MSSFPTLSLSLSSHFELENLEASELVGKVSTRVSHHYSSSLNYSPLKETVSLQKLALGLYSFYFIALVYIESGVAKGKRCHI